VLATDAGVALPSASFDVAVVVVGAEEQEEAGETDEEEAAEADEEEAEDDEGGGGGGGGGVSVIRRLPSSFTDSTVIPCTHARITQSVM
jgi:hypothetical protein